MNREVPVFIVVTAVVALGLFAAGQDPGDPLKGKPDITGRWELNLAKSKFGKANALTGMSLRANKQGHVLHSIQTSYDQAGGPDTVEGDWYLDGKERPLGSDGKMTSMSKWDGKTLVSERKSKDASYEESIRLNISSDGKTATEEIKLKSPNGNNSSTLVWERK